MADDIQRQRTRTALTLFRAYTPNAPDGWETLTVTRRSVSRTAETVAVATTPERTCGVRHSAGWEVSDAFNDLRQVMWEPHRGTWFTAMFTLQPNGDYTTSFNYDDEPDWVVPLSDPDEPGTVEEERELYRRDSNMFPRPADATPEWLKRKLDLPQ